MIEVKEHNTIVIDEYCVRFNTEGEFCFYRYNENGELLPGYDSVAYDLIELYDYVVKNLKSRTKLKRRFKKNKSLSTLCLAYFHGRVLTKDDELFKQISGCEINTWFDRFSRFYNRSKHYVVDSGFMCLECGCFAPMGIENLVNLAKGISESQRFIKAFNGALVCMSCVPYETYLKSDMWQHTRKQALKRAGYACQVCNASNVTLDVHHRTYERRGYENLSDLTVLCRKCHALYHGKEA